MVCNVYYVKDYGAVGDGITDDGPAINRTFNVALSTKLAPETIVKVVFDNKIYRIGEKKESWAYFKFINITNFIIEGNGASLLMKPTNYPFEFYNCKDIEVTDLSVDYDPLPFTQGTIISVDRDTGTVVFKVQKGYPHDLLAYEFLKKTHGQNGWSHAVIVESERYHRKVGTKNDHILIEKAEMITDSIYRLHIRESYKVNINGIDEGDRMYIGLGYTISMAQADAFKTGENSKGCFYIHKCSKMLVRNINIYTVPGRAFTLNDNEDIITIKNVKIMPKPGTDRLVSTIIDGIHGNNNRVGPVIEGCLVEAVMDDGINLNSLPEYILNVENETTFTTSHYYQIYNHMTIKAGDEIIFVDRSCSKIIGKAYVKKIEYDDAKRTRSITTDRIISDITAGDKDNLNTTIIYNYSAATNNYVIKNSVFRSLLRRSIAVAGINGLIENNTIDSLGGGGIWLNNAPSNYEGPFSMNVTVCSNRLLNNHITGIMAGWAG